MNDIEFMLGDMLNDEKRRILYIPLIDLTSITDPDILTIAQSLIQDKEFSFFDFYQAYGKDVTCKAMELANKAIQNKLSRKKGLL
jgi:hypothetical protein